jgi:hypothetical protein
VRVDDTTLDLLQRCHSHFLLRIYYPL